MASVVARAVDALSGGACMTDAPSKAPSAPCFCLRGARDKGWLLGGGRCTPDDIALAIVADVLTTGDAALTNV